MHISVNVSRKGVIPDFTQFQFYSYPIPLHFSSIPVPFLWIPEDSCRNGRGTVKYCTHHARRHLVFFREQMSSYVDNRVHTWALDIVRWWSSLYGCSCFRSWALVFIHAQLFLYMRSCFRTDAGEWGRGHGFVVVVEDCGGGGGGGHGSWSSHHHCGRLVDALEAL